jgi:Immunity protein family (Imm11)
VYFFFRENLFDSLGMFEIVGHTEETGRHLWTAGRKLDAPLPVETLLLDSSYGTNMPDIFDTTVPVMSAALLEGLREAGVNNFDEYSVVLQRADTGEQFKGFSAINFLGAIDAIDLDRTEFTTRRRGRKKFGGPIHLDEDKTGDLDAFRLSEGPGFLVVSETVAASLRAHAFKALLLQPTEEYAGD